MISFDKRLCRLINLTYELSDSKIYLSLNKDSKADFKLEMYALFIDFLDKVWVLSDELS